MTTRRNFCGAALACCAALATGRRGAASPISPSSQSIAVFEKILQNLATEKLANTLEMIDADGIEATIRPNGRIAPENAARELPNLVAALEKKNKKVLLAATNINRVDASSRELLKILADNGVTHYRMGYYRWATAGPLDKQISIFQRDARELAELNERLGLTACYQNHAGDGYVGSTIWDAARILEGVSPRQICLALDLRHLRVEIGLSWKSHIKLFRDHVGYLYVKDAVWKNNRLSNCPLGQGLVQPNVFHYAQQQVQSVPISLHLEYLGQRPLSGEPLEQAVDCYRRDIATLKGWFNEQKK